MILSGFATALWFGAVMPPNDISYWIELAENLQLSTSTLAFIKFYVALPATYHTFNGVRHLFWDNGKFLTINEVYSTGYSVVALSILSALGLAAL